MNQPKSVKDIARGDEPLAHIEVSRQPPLPPPYDNPDDLPPITPLTDAARDKYVVLDDTIALNIPKPTSREEEERLVNKFLDGFHRLFNEADNWTFLQPLMMSVEH